jgi:hypothetical protein
MQARDSEDPEYPLHPRTVRVPALIDREYRTLKDSIDHHGQQHPVELLKGTRFVLDGRHRICVCRELGIPIKTVEVDTAEDEVWRYTAAKAAVRSLTATQKALVALEFLPECERLAKDRRYDGVKVRQGEQGKAAALAASFVRVSPTYVEYAKKLQREHPALFERMLSGELDLRAAWREAKGQGKGTKGRRNAKPKDDDRFRIPHHLRLRITAIVEAIGDSCEGMRWRHSWTSQRRAVIGSSTPRHGGWGPRMNTIELFAGLVAWPSV